MMQQIVRKIREQGEFEVAIISMQSAKTEKTDAGVLELFVTRLEEWFEKDLPEIRSWKELSRLFGFGFANRSTEPSRTERKGWIFNLPGIYVFQNRKENLP
ncbi:hypothetical protein QUF80_14445 [Desulfococcaceae bacterium HSG8]|nr:hypothetical protein [Desulfococcaceae bacterium HSG8]